MHIHRCSHGILLLPPRVLQSPPKALVPPLPPLADGRRPSNISWWPQQVAVQANAREDGTSRALPPLAASARHREESHLEATGLQINEEDHEPRQPHHACLHGAKGRCTGPHQPGLHRVLGPPPNAGGPYHHRVHHALHHWALAEVHPEQRHQALRPLDPHLGFDPYTRAPALLDHLPLSPPAAPHSPTSTCSPTAMVAPPSTPLASASPPATSLASST